MNEYTDNFIQTDAKTNVVFAAFTAAHGRRLMVYEELDMLKKRVVYCETDSIIYLTEVETKVRGISLDCTVRKKVNFNVTHHALVFLRIIDISQNVR